MHNNLEYNSLFLCSAQAIVSGITINTARLHGGRAQRDIYLWINLSNTADVTDRLCALEWQMPAAWWPRCRTCAQRQEQKWGFGNDRLKQTAEWTDAWTAGDAQHFSHSSLCYFAVFVLPSCHLSILEWRKQEHFTIKGSSKTKCGEVS